MGEVSLEIIEGPHAGSRLRSPVPGEIGRDQSAEFALDDRLVSRRHARIGWDTRGYPTLEDLGSRNGTFLNGQPIEGLVPLKPNDTILVGVTVLCVRGPADSHAQPTALVTVPPALRGSPVGQPAPVSELDFLLDKNTKAKARTAPLAILILVVFVILIFLALHHHR